MNARKLLAVIAVAGAMSSCTYQKYNHYEQVDVRKDNPTVYGVHPDSAPKQLSITYPVDPALDLEAEKIRKMLYGNDKVNLK